MLEADRMGAMSNTLFKHNQLFAKVA